MFSCNLVVRALFCSWKDMSSSLTHIVYFNFQPFHAKFKVFNVNHNINWTVLTCQPNLIIYNCIVHLYLFATGNTVCCSKKCHRNFQHWLKGQIKVGAERSPIWLNGFQEPHIEISPKRIFVVHNFWLMSLACAHKIIKLTGERHLGLLLYFIFIWNCPCVSIDRIFVLQEKCIRKWRLQFLVWNYFCATLYTEGNEYSFVSILILNLQFTIVINL